LHLHAHFFTGESMTKDEALQMCLEYIETDAHERKYVRHAIKAALKAKDEPYAFEASMYSNDRVKVDPVTGNVSIGTPQRTWVGLTDAEVDQAFTELTLRKIYQAIEAKLKEKNT
jgi:hypothetical protein